MNSRPLPVTIIACVYILTGAGGFVLHLRDFKALQPFPYDNVLVELVSLTAVVAGAYLLRGENWARWLALAWMAFHVVVSVFHSLSQLAIHALFLAILGYFLFRPAANSYFRRK